MNLFGLQSLNPFYYLLFYSREDGYNFFRNQRFNVVTYFYRIWLSFCYYVATKHISKGISFQIGLDGSHEGYA